MARLTSQIFVASLIRQINQVGGNALIARKGSSESGAIYICLYSAQDRTHHLYEPAIGDAPTDTYLGGRVFRERQAGMTELEISEWLEREARFDPDCWLVEIEHCPLPINQLISLIDAV